MLMELETEPKIDVFCSVVTADSFGRKELRCGWLLHYQATECMNRKRRSSEIAENRFLQCLV